MVDEKGKQEKLKLEIHEKVKEYYKLYLSKKNDFIPASGKKFDENEFIGIVDAALDACWTEGKVTEQFEEKFSNFLGIKHAIVVNSGSSANLVALKTLTSSKLKEKRLKEGDEVITVAAGFPTTVNPIIECGCIPVFCDVDLQTYSIKIDQLEKAVSEKTKAVMVAHTLGNPFDIDAVRNICKENNLWLIEDNCDALGSKYRGRYTGAFGDLSTFSFYPAHQITMGEGGAVCTNDAVISKIARSFRDWGRDCWCKPGFSNTCGIRFDWKLGDLPKGYDHKYIFSEMGFNLKNTDLNVSIGLAQLDKLEDFIEIRKRNFGLLMKELNDCEYFILPKAQEHSEPCWFGFVITIKENSKISRNELTRFLFKNNIDSRLLFAGNLTKQPYFINNKIKYRIADNLKNTDLIMNNSFWVGVCPLIDNNDANKIVDCIKTFVEKNRKGEFLKAN